MKLIYGSFTIGKILDDGSVAVDLPAVTAALKQRRTMVYDHPVSAPDEPHLVMWASELVVLQALAAHRHEQPTAFASFRRWLKERL